MISKNKKKGKSKMSKAEQENRIVVDHVYKTFNIYMDKANSLKEKLLFWNRNRKEKREVLKYTRLQINKKKVSFSLEFKTKRLHLPQNKNRFYE